MREREMGDRDREMEMYERKENTDRDMCVRE